MAITGTVGNDSLSGTTGDDIFKLHQGGDDTAFGDAGDDVFRLRAALTALDSIDGGANRDKLILKGDYSAGLVFGASTMTNVENLRLAGAFDYDLTLDDGNVGAGQKLTVNATLSSGHFLTFDGSAELDGRFGVYGSAGNDGITGGALADKINLARGGVDTVNGGTGNDVVNVGLAFTAADTINGGADSDTVNIGNNAIGAITFTATTMTNVETLTVNGASSVLLIDSHDATVAAGATLTVDASTANLVDFDGSAETDGHFVMIGAAGGDNLYGGAQSDTFTLTNGGNDIAQGNGGDDLVEMGATLSVSDFLDGGAGTDTIDLNGDYSAGVTFSAATMNFEVLNLAAGHSYDLTTDDANVASGGNLNVNAGGLGATDDLIFDGSAESDGTFTVTAGAGNDTVVAGAGNDTIDAGAGIDDLTGGAGADNLTGGADIDRFHYAGVAASTSTTRDTIVGFDAADDFFDIHIATGFYNGEHNSSVAISAATFDANLTAAALGFNTANGILIVHAAAGGDLAGHSFLIVDVNGDTLYTGGVDYVWDVTGGDFTGMGVGNFI